MRLVIVFFIYLFTNMRLVNSWSLNFTNLLINHLTMCGPGYVCNATQFSYMNLNFNISKSHKLCPDCSCDNMCFGRGDCCPDKYFSLSGLVCDNVTSVNATYDESRDQKASYLMIKECPYGTDQFIKEKCEKEYDSLDKLKYPPVTSNLTNLTYSNGVCAQCNDETSYQFWNLDIYCRVFLDINFLSSFKEVVDNGIEHKCILQFVPLDDKPVFNCYQTKEIHFNICNKTGFWKTRDDDVAYACESDYVNNDAFFKNPFCKMCNPTFYEGEAITQCNVTGLWNFFDESVEEACSRFKLNEGILPFKNIFCRICNAPENMRYSFVDVSANITPNVVVTMNKNIFYYLFVKINNFLKDYFDFVTNNFPESKHRIKPITSGILFHDNQTLNVSKLVYQSISLKKYVKVCNNYSFPNNLSSFILSCSCEPSCFRHNSCCEDFALQYPTKCIHSKHLAGSSFKSSWPDVEYLVTNGCYKQFRNALYMEELCKNGDRGHIFSGIFSSHPVRDLRSGLSYLNMFCYLCNRSPNQPDFDFGKPWHLESYCKKYIEHKNFIMMNRLLKTIMEAKCDVTYFPDIKLDPLNVTPQCSSRGITRYRGTCNSTEKWFVEDPDIKYACENVSSGALNQFDPESYMCELPFKNVFCALCNPEVIENISISECSVNGNNSFYSELDDVGCQFFPEISFYSPFKNLFCKHCNNRRGVHHFCLPFNFLSKRQWFMHKRYYGFSIYRNLFMYTTTDDELSEDESTKCKSTETYFSKMNQCRNLTCYPGKYLRNGTCQALFTVTKNLGYFLTSDFRGNVSSLLPVYDLLNVLSKEIKHTILSKLQMSSDSMEYLFVRIDQPCFKRSQILSSQQFSGSIAVGIFIKQVVERVDIENRLIAITTKMVVSKNETFDLHLSFTMRMNQLPYKPYKIYLSEYFSRCTLPELVKYQAVEERPNYRNVRISKLLTCVQVLLEFGEYRIDEQSGKLKVLGMSELYEYDSFENLPDGSARICTEDFKIGTIKEIFSSDAQNQTSEFLLSKITLILNVISILCLTLSFLIYVFKKNLRTMPGKINMILILSLVLTLVVFQLSKFGIYQREACVWFGIAVHYFWLMYFSSMTVSSFHMYRIFEFSNINTSNGFNNILRVYIAFITIFPCVVVVLNIMISWQVSGNGDIGYGNTMCFIDNTYSRLASFIIPVGIMCLCSLFFFVRTIISIKRVPKVPGNQSVRNEFGIFCRLFTVTGITWSLQIIDGFLPFTTFSYISSIINSLQGTAIFIAFFLNKRVLGCTFPARKDPRSETPAGESAEETNTDVTRL